MKRKCRNSVSSCSSSSSSSCIDSPLIIPEENDANKKKPNKATKKIISLNNSHATSAKSRSSIYRGVTRHRWTGRFEAHLWDKTTWNNIQNKRGRQIYLGAYDNEDDAARTYDLAALKFWGPASILNFPVERYSSEVEEMQKLSKEEFLASLRRRSSGFSRGVSKYRGVARHHHNGRWEARIGRVCGNKYLYLGTYSTQEEAAAAYDMAAIEFRGPNAVTNFDISNYAKKDEIQVKQEVNPQVQEDHDVHQHNSNQFVEPNNIPKLEFIDKVQEDDQQELEASNIPKFEVIEPQDIVMDDHQELEPSNISKFELIESQDIVIVTEHPWDLCLDMGFSSLPIPIEKSSEMLGLLDDKGFEDNIEFIFDDAISGTEECSKVEVDVLVPGHDVSSPLSVCSNI